MVTSIKTSQPLLKDRATTMQLVSKFWDKISLGWQEVWGPHIHHGFYEKKSDSPIEAQERLIINLIKLMDLKAEATILDAGCGLGGSSIYLAEKFNATVTGITLSSKQVLIAKELAENKKLKNVNFKVEDALKLSSFKDESFDVIWSLESCEQFFDKELFVEQAYRKLKPGGKLLLATWCSNEEEYRNKLATKYKKLCIAFDLPSMPTREYYQQILMRQKFTLLENQDWSSHVKQSWHVGVTLVNAISWLKIIKKGGFRGLKFARQIKMMRDAFEEGRVNYIVFVAKK